MEDEYAQNGGGTWGGRLVQADGEMVMPLCGSEWQTPLHLMAAKSWNVQAATVEGQPQQPDPT